MVAVDNPGGTGEQETSFMCIGSRWDGNQGGGGAVRNYYINSSKLEVKPLLMELHLLSGVTFEQNEVQT